MMSLIASRQRADNEFRRHAELVRLQTVELINIQLSKRDKFKKASALWPFPWDEQEAVTPASVDPEMAMEHLNKLINHIDQL